MGDIENLIIQKTNGKIAQGYVYKLCTDGSWLFFGKLDGIKEWKLMFNS